jgi:hypothetical protein
MRSAGSSGRTMSARPVSTSYLQAAPGCLAEQQLGELARNPLGGDATQLAGHRRHRGTDIRRDSHSEGRHEPRRPQHAERIVSERLFGRAGRPQYAARQIGQPSVRIAESAVTGHRQGHGIHREVATAQVVLE